jgi:hypothetical protein
MLNELLPRCVCLPSSLCYVDLVRVGSSHISVLPVANYEIKWRCSFKYVADVTLLFAVWSVCKLIHLCSVVWVLNKEALKYQCKSVLRILRNKKWRLLWVFFLLLSEDVGNVPLTAAHGEPRQEP